MTIREYAQHRGVSERQVYRALRDGRISRGPHGIDAAKADREWSENTDLAKSRHSARGQVSEPKPRARSPRGSGRAAATLPTLADSKRIEAHYRAELARLAAEQNSGGYVAVDEVERAAFNSARLARDRLLMIPTRLAPQLVGRDADAIEQLLVEEINTALLDLSNPSSFAPGRASAVRRSRTKAPSVRHPRASVSMPTRPSA